MHAKLLYVNYICAFNLAFKFSSFRDHYVQPDSTLKRLLQGQDLQALCFHGIFPFPMPAAFAFYLPLSTARASPCGQLRIT